MTNATDFVDAYLVLRYVRSGGFRGQTVSETVCSATALPAEINQLQQLVDLADFFKITVDQPDDLPVADDYSYEMTVVLGEKRRTMKLREFGAPQNMRPLLDFINRRADNIAK